jgi:hypothetical protein
LTSIVALIIAPHINEGGHDVAPMHHDHSALPVEQAPIAATTLSLNDRF